MVTPAHRMTVSGRQLLRGITLCPPLIYQPVATIQALHPWGRDIVLVALMADGLHRESLWYRRQFGKKQS